MHGLVFVAIEHHLRVTRDEGTLRACFPLPGRYLAIADYPDDDLLEIARLAARRLSSASLRPVDDVLRRLGEAVPGVIQRLAPASLPRASSLAELAQQHERGEAPARSLFPPLAFQRRDDGLIAVVHKGDPRLCRFAEGLLVGFGALVGESLAFRHPTCRQRGEPECVFIARFIRQETTAISVARPGPKKG